MAAQKIIEILKEKSDPKYLAGMQRFGIDSSKALGIPLPELRKVAKAIKRNHDLAIELWKTGFHEARILASLVDEPSLVTEKQIDD